MTPAPNRRWLRFALVAVVAISTLLGMFFGFWLGMVAFLTIPDPVPPLPDWVWVVPYALSLAVGIISLLVSAALMRKFTRK
jgi:hypothetical protein